MKEVNSNKRGNLSNSRRDFIEKSGLTAAMTVFGLAFFTGCTDEEDQTPAVNMPPASSATGISVSGSTIRIDLDIQDGLKTSGAWILIVAAQTLVVNVNGSYNALTSVCTHSACDRNWTFGSNIFTCTCHGSEFDTSGKVLKGPAAQPLESFTTAVSGNTLTITK